jgi:hypothetical protein
MTGLETDVHHRGAVTSNCPRFAPGGPGIEPRWTRGAKIAVGTAYSTSSRIWYTLDHGGVTEICYPTVDSPQIRDLQFLVTDGETFFHDERRHFVGQIDYVAEAALGFEVDSKEKSGGTTMERCSNYEAKSFSSLIKETPGWLSGLRFPTPLWLSLEKGIIWGICKLRRMSLSSGRRQQ